MRDKMSITLATQGIEDFANRVEPVSWTELKAIIDVLGASEYFYREYDSLTSVWTTQGIVDFICRLTHGTAEYTDFVDNYKANAKNIWLPQMRIVDEYGQVVAVQSLSEIISQSDRALLVKIGNFGEVGNSQATSRVGEPVQVNYQAKKPGNNNYNMGTYTIPGGKQLFIQQIFAISKEDKKATFEWRNGSGTGTRFFRLHLDDHGGAQEMMFPMYNPLGPYTGEVRIYFIWGNKGKEYDAGFFGYLEDIPA